METTRLHPFTRSALAILPVLALLAATGCGTAAPEAGYHPEADAPDAPSSLFEMRFGPDGTEVTKNLPGDAAQHVGERVRSLRGSSPPDEVAGE